MSGTCDVEKRVAAISVEDHCVTKKVEMGEMIGNENKHG